MPGQTRGRLIVVARDGGEGPSFPLASESMDIGREEGQVIVAEDGFLSPRHARLVWRGGKLFLVDLASANGIYLRLGRVLGVTGEGSGPLGTDGSWRLVDQDLILVGQQVLRFESVRDAESSLGPASEHGTLLFGTPVGPRYARLCQRSVEGVTRDVYYLRKMETVLGRESGDIIFTEDPFLSRRHAAVRVERGTAGELAFTLADLGSSNGCFVRIRGEVCVTNGDQFRVGQQLFRVELDQSRAGQPS
jgi:pSer/pThr/pTyr-binding forkhead associated (FHA) protein